MSLLSCLGRLFCCRCKTTTTNNNNTLHDDDNNDLSKNLLPPPEETETTTSSSIAIITPTVAKKDSEFHFLENSHKMYTDVVNLSPKLFRHFARKAYKAGMHEHAETIDGVPNSINERIMYVVVKEKTPKKHLKQALETLDKDRTVPPRPSPSDE